MGPRGGGRGELSRRGDAVLLAACARLYRTLLVLYPKAFRRRYGAEMRRDFGELSREGLEEGGAKGLAGVLALGLSDLAVTALAERSTAAARRGAHPLSVDPRMAAKAITASLLAAVVVAVASLWQTPTYEASAKVLLGQKEQKSYGKIHPIPNAPTPRRLQALTQTMIIAIDTRPVANEAIRRLELGISPDELLNNLTIEQIESSQFIQLSYTDSDAARATQVVNTVGQVSSERISEASATANSITANVWQKAEVPSHPASPKPLRNGVLTLVAGLVLCAGLAKLALPGVGARVAGTLGERPSHQGVGQAWVLGRWHSDTSIVERIKEKKLLLALGRRGKLRAVEAALETSLSVEEADRMLSELAHNGHLKVTVEHGRLLYSFWEHRAP